MKEQLGLGCFLQTFLNFFISFFDAKILQYLKSVDALSSELKKDILPFIPFSTLGGFESSQFGPFGVITTRYFLC